MLYILITGCGLIIDIACLATGRPCPTYTYEQREKTDSERNVERMQKEMDRDMAEMREEGDRRQQEIERGWAEQRQRDQAHQEAILESLKRGEKVNFP